MGQSTAVLTTTTTMIISIKHLSTMSMSRWILISTMPWKKLVQTTETLSKLKNKKITAETFPKGGVPGAGDCSKLGRVQADAMTTMTHGPLEDLVCRGQP